MVEMASPNRETVVRIHARKVRSFARWLVNRVSLSTDSMLASSLSAGVSFGFFGSSWQGRAWYRLAHWCECEERFSPPSLTTEPSRWDHERRGRGGAASPPDTAAPPSPSAAEACRGSSGSFSPCPLHASSRPPSQQSPPPPLTSLPAPSPHRTSSERPDGRPGERATAAPVSSSSANPAPGHSPSRHSAVARISAVLVPGPGPTQSTPPL
mmetsp:Transcript_22103/g.70614  ORF Transcript_22103/g.70614 Transcript_22103/m.70614 type:complete len:211 (+) Transcript_22103:519-1151(+)